MKKISIFGIIVVLVNLLTHTCAEKKIYRIEINQKDDKSCHLKALDQCLNKAYYLTHHLNGTDLITNHKEFDQMCHEVIKVINCTDKYFDRCSYPVHKQVYQLGKDQFYQSWNQICTEGPVKNNFIKHSKCIQKSVKNSKHYKSVCINNLQKAFDKSTASDNMVDIVNIGCCAFNQWQDCIDDLVHKKCGLDGKLAVKELIEKASGGIIYNLCSKDYFNSKSQICVKELVNK